MSIRSSFLAMREPRFSAFVLTRSGEHITQFGYQVFFRTTCPSFSNIPSTSFQRRECIVDNSVYPFSLRQSKALHFFSGQTHRTPALVSLVIAPEVLSIALTP